MNKRLRAMATALALITGPAVASPPSPVPACTAASATATRTAVIAGQRRTYRVCAGTIPVRDATGGATGSIFYTAYLMAAKKPRPIAFVWNGGPGADSRLLQFHALGPRTLHGEQLADNDASPLDAADLVFVDPIGTGFSRAAPPAAANDFYGTVADIAATARFVRAFLTDHRRVGAPLYLIGESFGTWRAAGVAETLIDAGVPVAGVALISGGIPLGETDDRPQMRAQMQAQMQALSLANRTATALAWQRLAPALQADPERTLADARSWAATVYAPALAAPGALTPGARADVIAVLARYQGLPASSIDPATLWVSPRQFRNQLLGNGPPLGIFDMRRRGADAADAAGDRATIEFYRHDLGLTTGRYAGIEEPASPVGARWRYDQSPITPASLARAQAGEGPPSAAQPWTRRGMEKAPKLRTWVAAGQFDSLNSCDANAATVATLPPAIASRMLLHCYAGGHMMYDDPAVAPRFGADLRQFLRGAPPG